MTKHSKHHLICTQCQQLLWREVPRSQNEGHRVIRALQGHAAWHEERGTLVQTDAQRQEFFSPVMDTPEWEGIQFAFIDGPDFGCLAAESAPGDGEAIRIKWELMQSRWTLQIQTMILNAPDGSPDGVHFFPMGVTPEATARLKRAYEQLQRGYGPLTEGPEPLRPIAEGPEAWRRLAQALTARR